MVALGSDFTCFWGPGNGDLYGIVCSYRALSGTLILDLRLKPLLVEGKMQDQGSI